MMHEVVRFMLSENKKLQVAILYYIYFTDFHFSESVL